MNQNENNNPSNSSYSNTIWDKIKELQLGQYSAKKEIEDWKRSIDPLRLDVFPRSTKTLRRLGSSWSTWNLRLLDAASESEDTSSWLNKPVRRWRADSRLPKGFESSLARTSFRQRSNLVTGSQEYRDSSEDTKVNRSRAEDWQNPSEKSATTKLF